MSIKVSFADMTHMGQVVAANTFPLGLTMVAAYAQQELGDDIDFEVFKYPDDFSQYLETTTPKIACFSAFSWNVSLGHEFAKRLKKASPETITVFGGPNFPAEKDEQKAFLEEYPAIDCFFEFEGERVFVQFFKALKEIDFNWEQFKREYRTTPSIRYLVDGEFISAELMEKTVELDVLPSPHLSGISDKFYDNVLIPYMQMARGCPYACTFCWEGGDYFQKTKRFSMERIKSELNYIAKRAKVPDFGLSDANFGMFQEDIEIAGVIRTLQKKYDWPKSITAATAKNHKKNTMDIVEILGDTMPSFSSVQSTDKDVLKKIKRKNVPMEQMALMAELTVQRGGQSQAEVILCLHGDSKKTHFKSVFDMLDAGMTFIRMYQHMMLPGTEGANTESREKYSFETRFRVLPRCFGYYEFRGEIFSATEIEEIVISNNTMSYEDYQDCRNLHLTTEIFNNDSSFLDIIQFLKRQGIKTSEFIEAVHEAVVQSAGSMAKLYDEFREEEKKNFWFDIDELRAFVKEPGAIDKYINGEYGTNELYKYRALAIWENIEEMHEIVYTVAQSLLEGKVAQDPLILSYLSELREFSLLRKIDVLNTNRAEKRVFHFDFPKLKECKFEIAPEMVYFPEGREMEIYHSDSQRKLIEGYISQYGTDLIGISRILVRANMNRLYRNIRSIDCKDNGNILALDSKETVA